MIRTGIRRLFRAPAFTAAAILTLTLGTSVLAIAFSVVYAVLLRPLPYPQPDRLVSLSHTLVVGRSFRVGQSDASIVFYHQYSGAFSHLGGYRAATAALGPVDRSAAERVPAAFVTEGVLPALSVAPLRGRLFSASDDRPGAPPVAIVGEGLWRRKYGADPALLNQTVNVDGVPYQVVGIVSAGVRFPLPETELWLPLQLNPLRTDSASFDYEAVARLRADTTIAAAESELQKLLERMSDASPGRLTRASITQTHMQASVRPLADTIVGDVGRLLWIVLGASCFVLAIACANVANLFLVRGEARATALWVQRALGASVADIFFELLSEAAVIAAVAVALALAAARAGIRMLQSLDTASGLPRLTEVSVDAVVVVVIAAVAMTGAVVVSAISALRASRVEGVSALGDAGRSATAGAGRHRIRHVLVVSQVALALVLAAGAGLMGRSIWRLRAVHPGVDASNALTFRVALPSATYPAAGDVAQFVTRALDGIESAGGATAAGAVSKIPLDDQGRTDTAVFVEDRPIAPGSLPGIHPVAYATPGYFAAAGIPIVSGRTFAPLEPKHVVLEAVVSRAFASRYWPTGSPVGRRVRIYLRGPSYTIVGVVGDVRDAALDRPADEIIYCPLLPPPEDPRWTPRDLAFVVRMADRPSGIDSVRQVVRSLDPSIPVYRVRSLQQIVTHASARRWFTLLLIGAASVVALLLGAVGLYGVMAYVVALRTRELAIRLALGAQPGELRRMVSFQGLRMAVAGIVIGLAAALAMTRVLATLLYEVSPTDPMVLAVSSGVLLIVAAAASWLPTRRATSIDPASALTAN